MSTFGELNPITTAALAWYDAGCSIIPIRADGTKKPVGEWKPQMSKRFERPWISGHFRNNPEQGIGIICGQVSGNLEMLELEGRACNGDVLDQILEACGLDSTFDMLLHSGYCEWTPSGGLHFLYRISDHEVPGNTKVARRAATETELTEKPTDRIKVLAETRGEGGYVVVAPSGGTVHATGDSWSVAAGHIGVIPTITWQQRQTMVEAIHNVLDEMPQATQAPPRPSPASLLPGRDSRPGDDFNNRAEWRDILLPHGWSISHTAGHTTYWVRPGKEARLGHSATTGRAADGDRLYVFSSATVFEAETPYNKFAAYVLLEHNGDYAAGARALRTLGYGSPATSSMASPGPAPATTPMGFLDHPQPATPVPVTAVASGTAVAVRDANWDKLWAKPYVPSEAFIWAKHNYAGSSGVYADVYQDTFKYCVELKKWYFYSGQVWQEDRLLQHEDAIVHLIDEASEQATRKADESLAKWVNTMSKSPSPAMAKWARSNPKIAVLREQFDQRRHLITLENGIFDLDTATFTNGHDPKLLLTKKLGIVYDKDAKSQRWDSFLAQVLPGQDIRGYIQRAAGLTLLGNADERALFLLHGKSGTGKSQFIRVMELLFGDFAETATAATFNATSKTVTLTNDLNDLRGKRFVSLSELDQDEKLNESLVKRLTGGDTAKSRGMYQENRQWRVEFMMWMATNYLPRLSSDDNAIWKRVKPIEFPTEVANLGPEVRGLAESIFAEESSGILNWLLEGVRMYQEHGLDDLKQITEAVATYRRDVDSVAQFIDTAAEEGLIVQEQAAQMPSRTLHTMYQGWCQGNGVRWLGERRFCQRMESLGFERKRTNTGTVWLGVGTGGYGMLGTMPMRQ